MNQSPEQDMSPEDAALVAQAKASEVAALNDYLQNRVLVLNVEVRRRDAIIANLESEVAQARAATAPGGGEPAEAVVPPVDSGA